MLDFEDVFARRSLLLELDERACDVRSGEFGNLQALDFLAPRLHLAGPRAGGEARDEFVQLGNLLFALGVLRLDLRTHLRLGHHHVVIAAGVGDDSFVIDVGDVGANAVQKMPVVRDGNDDAVVDIQKSLQPVNGIEVEVVRRFVEQQRLRMPEQSLRQQDPDFLSTLQLAHLAGVDFIGNVEALQQNGGVALSGVAVLFADNAFEFAEFHAVGVSDLRLLVNGVAFLHGRPQPLVAHDDGVNRGISVESKLVLA